MNYQQKVAELLEKIRLMGLEQDRLNRIIKEQTAEIEYLKQQLDQAENDN